MRHAGLWPALVLAGCAASPDVRAGERLLLWSACLGGFAYGSPVVADGIVWIGTNNENPRDPAVRGDAGVLMAFRESDGLFLGQHVSPRLKAEMWIDWPSGSIRGAPRVQGDRLWYLNTRWEVVCLDIEPLKRGPGEPRVVWSTDLIAAAGVAPLGPGMGWGPGAGVAGPYRGLVYASTGNGIDWNTWKPARPEAPALVCLDSETGRIVGRERSGISKRTVHAEWSSPVLAETSEGRTLLLYGGGDGCLYGFDPDPRSGVLTELWRADGHPPGREERRGILVAPAVDHGRAYAVLSGDIDESGPGALVCIDLATGRKIWSFDALGLSWTTPRVRRGVVYAADRNGYLHAVDADDGSLRWTFDTLATLYGCLGWTGERLCLGTDEGGILLFDVGAMERVARSGRAETRRGTDVQAHDFPDMAVAPPASAGDTIFLATMTELYAIRRFGDPQPPWTTVRPRPSPGALFVPTPEDVVEAMLDAARAGPADIVYDLGSGDGRIVAAAARRGARAVGVEIDPDLVERSRGRLKTAGLDARARIVAGDILDADFADATVVVLYVGERLNRMLVPKLRALKPGTRVVSHEFGIPGWTPDRTIRLDSAHDGRPHRVHVWTVGKP